MFEKKKKKSTKIKALMKKALAAGAVELGDDVLENAAGGAMISALRVVNNFTESASDDAADFFGSTIVRVCGAELLTHVLPLKAMLKNIA